MRTRFAACCCAVASSITISISIRLRTTQRSNCVRFEQLCPFPEEAIQQLRRKYRKATEWIWVQEEPQNMGAWTFMEPRLRTLEIAVEYVGRDASASSATGSHKIHK